MFKRAYVKTCNNHTSLFISYIKILDSLFTLLAGESLTSFSSPVGKAIGLIRPILLAVDIIHESFKVFNCDGTSVGLDDLEVLGLRNSLSRMGLFSSFGGERSTS